VRAGEQALVVVSARKIDLLRKCLRVDAGKILFADRGDVGTNPTRIIPAWTDFVNEHAGRTLRGPYDTSALDRDVVLSRKRVGAIPSSVGTGGVGAVTVTSGLRHSTFLSPRQSPNPDLVCQSRLQG
jgi:hypothetical protein